jgi:hypothetical protein
MEAATQACNISPINLHFLFLFLDQGSQQATTGNQCAPSTKYSTAFHDRAPKNLQ